MFNIRGRGLCTKSEQLLNTPTRQALGGGGGGGGHFTFSLTGFKIIFGNMFEKVFRAILGW